MAEDISRINPEAYIRYAETQSTTDQNIVKDGSAVVKYTQSAVYRPQAPFSSLIWEQHLSNVPLAQFTAPPNQNPKAALILFGSNFVPILGSLGTQTEREERVESSNGDPVEKELITNFLQTSKELYNINQTLYSQFQRIAKG